MAKTLTTQSLDLSAFSSKLAEQYTVEHIISTQSSELVLQIRSKSDAEDYVLQIYSFSYPLLRHAKKMQSNHPDMLLLHENGLLILLSPSFIELLPKEQPKRNAFLHSKYLPYVAFLFCSCLFLYSIHDALRKKMQILQSQNIRSFLLFPAAKTKKRLLPVVPYQIRPMFPWPVLPLQ